MRHLRLVAVLGAIAAVAAGARARAAGNPYLYEQASATPGADQGSNPNYRSYITAVTPAVPGLQVQILAFADRLQIFNHTGRTVTIYGYQGEPYARLLAGGAVQLNERSPALYLNTSFYGGGTIPASANPNLPAEMGHGVQDGHVPMARPPHPLAVPRAAAAGEGQGQAHAHLQLDGPDRRRRVPRGDRGPSCSGRRAPRRPRRPRISRSLSSPCSAWRSCSSCAVAGARRGRSARSRPTPASGASPARPGERDDAGDRSPCHAHPRRARGHRRAVELHPAGRRGRRAVRHHHDPRPAELEFDLDPARVGANTIHIYLINPRDGSQFTATQELDVQASLPSKGIGPLTLIATPAGPGHYVVSAHS